MRALARAIARKAYFSYRNQGSLPGHDVQHWLQAEADLLEERMSLRTHGQSQQVPKRDIELAPFQKVLHTVRIPIAQVLPHSKASKTTAKTRDLREDRGIRQMKTGHDEQTFHTYEP